MPEITDLKERINSKFHDKEETIMNNWLIVMKKNKEAPYYSIVCPPPNVTGALHIGHAVTFSYIDIKTRYEMLQGKNVIVRGGTDHASIATTTMVKKHYGSEVNDLNFMEKAKEWIIIQQNTIKDQIRKLGVLMDWENFSYTLDSQNSMAVEHAFQKLSEKGLIFKDKKMVNWDTFFQTAISDLEVQMVEENGKLYYIEYKVQGDEKESIIVATTRPETIFADCAIAINPEDEDKKYLVGKYVFIPITNRLIPIITSNKVKKDFGTGFLKITPAHDFKDYEIWKDSLSETKTNCETYEVIGNYEIIDILQGDGKLSGQYVPQDFQNLNILEAREKIEKDLQLESKPIKHSIPKSDRSNTIVEPKITEQWFCDLRKFAPEAINLVEQDLIKFIPKSIINNYKSWLNNLDLWCISRDLQLGHPIPGDRFTLDTWFSSSLFHKTCFGWPNSNSKEVIVPDLLVTGYDILFFWVTRMILMSIALEEEDSPKKIAFKNVIFHGLVRDKFGNKMSKTKNNVINPLDIIEVYGLDNLRLTLILNSINSRDLKITEESFKVTERILTKIKSGAFYCMNFAKPHEKKTDFKNLILGPVEIGILGISNKYFQDFQRLMENSELNEAIKLILQNFFIHNFCDQFIEMHKALLCENSTVISHVLCLIFEKFLQCLHPFAPFITENLWTILKDKNISILENKFELFPLETNTLYEDAIYSIFEINKIIRFFKQVFNCKNVTISLLKNEVFLDEDLLLKADILVSKMTKVQWKEQRENSVIYKDSYSNSWILGSLDLDPKILAKEIAKIRKAIENIKERLADQNFVKYAQPEIVSNYRKQLESEELLYNCLQARL